MTRTDVPADEPFPMGEREFVILMAFTIALLALAIDMMLPALAAISSDLGVSDPNERQLVVGLYLVAAGAGSLFPGVLADRFGRRPVLLGSLGAYIVLSLASAAVTSFEMLLAVRFAMGFITSGLFVLPMAIIRDRFEGDRMASAQSLVGMVFMVVPMLAPTAGQAVYLVAGWRMIFVSMALIALPMALWAWYRLPETLRPEHRQKIRPGIVAVNMFEAVTRREASGYFVAASLIQGALFGYINSSQQLIAEHFAAGTLFPIIFGGMALMMAGANFTNARIVERFGARRVSQTAVLFYIANGAVMLALVETGLATLWSFVPLMTVAMVLMGFTNANFQAIALQPFGHIAGAASSIQACLRMTLGAVLGTLIGQAYDGTAQPLALALIAAGVGSLALVLYSERGKLFRRLYQVRPPRQPSDWHNR